jgi:hypothetical protein
MLKQGGVVLVDIPRTYLKWTYKHRCISRASWPLDPASDASDKVGPPLSLTRLQV